MNGLTWLSLTTSSIIGTVLVALIGALLFALLLGHISGQLTRNDEHLQDY